MEFRHGILAFICVAEECIAIIRTYCRAAATCSAAVAAELC
jgi:hypothetical protein